jgi:hypothetical protein
MTSEQSLPLGIAPLQCQLNAALRNIQRCASDANALQKEFVQPKPKDPQLKPSNDINFDFEMNSPSSLIDQTITANIPWNSKDLLPAFLRRLPRPTTSSEMLFHCLALMQ